MTTVWYFQQNGASYHLKKGKPDILGWLQGFVIKGIQGDKLRTCRSTECENVM